MCKKILGVISRGLFCYLINLLNLRATGATLSARTQAKKKSNFKVFAIVYMSTKSTIHTMF